MRYLSVCSGIEAASVAWYALGWTPVGFSEIEPFPSAVLAHRFPNVPNFGDMTKHKKWPLGPESIDLLVGGTPCQSFSVAGLRKGLSDPRGGLMLTYLEIAQRLRPRWVVWENVPGVLSSNGGRDFGAFLGALGELGYGWAYRVLDAQWVRTHGHPRAVPQRRRRVFVVGCLIERCAGDWTAAAEVLFERESVQRDSAKGRAAREELPSDAGGCAASVCSKWSKGTGGPAGDECQNLTLQPVANTLGNRGLRSHTELDGHGAYVPTVYGIYGGNKRSDRPDGGFYVREESTARTLDAANSNPTCSQGGMCIAQPVHYDLFQITAPVNKQNRQPGDPCHTLARDNAAHAAVAFTVDMQACKGNANVGDGAVSPTLCKPSGNDVHAVVHAFYSTAGTHGLQAQAEVSPAVAAPTITATNDPSRSPQFAEGQGSRIRGVESESETLRATKRGPFTDFYTTPMTVRRLTPRECERLQAFPDDWTLIPWRGKPADQCPDGPRYKALGNSMACNVVNWIGQRIAAVDSSHAKR